ncbi:hypothetical protein H4R34_005344 [Dimargaris verticillata]|uniref:Ser-Thr-rich glycosyl-phosphatidyl-inositol-anchored membrane family-domain-containing protein n=1 Tax=Dimargaris verticillata TaxID=2761393 RepID=A0A9W8AX75_9FUNG|nr:hypothetical protein H4R34_005344 [Dimargaris verticillata]
MKSLTASLLLAIVAMGQLALADITIKEPSAKLYQVAGSPMNVRWTTNGTVPEFVNIVLHNNESAVYAGDFAVLSGVRVGDKSVKIELSQGMEGENWHLVMRSMTNGEEYKVNDQVAKSEAFEIKAKGAEPAKANETDNADDEDDSDESAAGVVGPALTGLSVVAGLSLLSPTWL